MPRTKALLHPYRDSKFVSTLAQETGILLCSARFNPSSTRPLCPLRLTRDQLQRFLLVNIHPYPPGEHSAKLSGFRSTSFEKNGNVPLIYGLLSLPARSFVFPSPRSCVLQPEMFSRLKEISYGAEQSVARVSSFGEWFSAWRGGCTAGAAESGEKSPFLFACGGVMIASVVQQGPGKR